MANGRKMRRKESWWKARWIRIHRESINLADRKRISTFWDDYPWDEEKFIQNKKDSLRYIGDYIKTGEL